MQFIQHGEELWGEPAEGELELLRSAVRIARAYYAGRGMTAEFIQMNAFNAGLAEEDGEPVKGPILAYTVVVDALKESAKYMDMSQAEAARALAAEVQVAISETESGATG